MSPLALAAACGHAGLVRLLGHCLLHTFPLPTTSTAGGAPAPVPATTFYPYDRAPISSLALLLPCEGKGLDWGVLENDAGFPTELILAHDCLHAITAAVHNGRMDALFVLLEEDSVFGSRRGNLRAKARELLLERDSEGGRKHGRKLAMLLHDAVSQPYVAVTQMLFRWLRIVDHGATTAHCVNSDLLEVRNNGLTVLQNAILAQTAPMWSEEEAVSDSEDAVLLRQPRNPFGKTRTEKRDEASAAGHGATKISEDPDEKPESAGPFFPFDTDGNPRPEFLTQAGFLKPRFARDSDHAHIVQFLIKAGACLDARVEAGHKLPANVSALAVAVGAFKPRTAQLLLEKQPSDPSSPSHEAEAAVLEILAAQEWGVWDRLFEHLDIAGPPPQSRQTDQQESPTPELQLLQKKLRAPATELILLLLAHIKPNTASTLLDRRLGRLFGAPTPLFVAAKMGNSDIVDALLRAGADPSVATLGWARLQEHTESGLTFNKKAPEGTRAGAFRPQTSDPHTPRASVYCDATPLHVACLMGFADVARSLLEALAKQESGTSTREEPLGISKSPLDWNKPKMRLDPGSDPALPPQYRAFLQRMGGGIAKGEGDLVAETALGLAVLAKRPAVVAELSRFEGEVVGRHLGTAEALRRRRAFAEPNDIVHMLARVGIPECREIVKLLIAHGVDCSGKVELNLPLPETQGKVSSYVFFCFWCSVSSSAGTLGGRADHLMFFTCRIRVAFIRFFGCVPQVTHLSFARHFSLPMLLLVSNGSDADVSEVMESLVRATGPANLNRRVTFRLYEKTADGNVSLDQQIIWSVWSLAQRYRPGAKELHQLLSQLGARAEGLPARDGVEEGRLVVTKDGSEVVRGGILSDAEVDNAVRSKEGDEETHFVYSEKLMQVHMSFVGQSAPAVSVVDVVRTN